MTNAPPQDDSLRDPVQIQERQRQATIKRNWDAFNGVFPDAIVKKRGVNQPNFSLKVGLIKAPVRKQNAFLMGQDVEIEVKPLKKKPAPAPMPAPDPLAPPPAPDDTEDPAQVYLDEFWEANRKMITLQKAARYGAITGDAFIKLVLDPAELYPRLVVLDPLSVTVETLPDDCDRALAFTLSYQMMDKGTLYDYEQRITRDDSGKSWTMQDFRRPADDKNKPWQAVNNAQRWSYAFPPIFHAPDTINPGSYYGSPAITEDIIHLNLAYNFILSALYKAAHFFGSPRQKGFGFKESDLPADPDKITILPSEKSTLELIEGKIDFAGALSLADRLEAALYKLLSVNGMSLGDLTDIPKGQIAALAIQLLYQVLIDLTNERRLCYEHLLKDICTAVLQIGMGQMNRRVNVRWPQMLPIDYATAAPAAISAQQAGVSKKTSVEQILGLDWDVEEQRNKTSTPSLAETILSQFNAGTDLPGTPPQNQPAPTHPAMLAQQQKVAPALPGKAAK